MGFYKPGANHTADPKMARLHKIIWTLIFVGLLAVILGVFVAKTDDAMGWTLAAAGGLMTAVGILLIYVRSKITSAP